MVRLLVAGLSISSLLKYITSRCGRAGAWWRTVALSMLKNLAAGCGAFLLGIAACCGCEFSHRLRVTVTSTTICSLGRKIGVTYSTGIVLTTDRVSRGGLHSAGGFFATMRSWGALTSVGWSTWTWGA
jgi:hypothetical protein